MLKKKYLVSLIVVTFLAALASNTLNLVCGYHIIIRVQPIILSDIKREYVYLEGRGEDDVITAVTKSDPEILVEESRHIGEKTSVGVKLYVVNASSTSFLCTIVMTSSKPFSVNIYHVSGSSLGTPLQFMSLPSNVSAQIEIPIFYGGQNPTQTSLHGVRYSPAFPYWTIAVYTLFISMFIATAYFDKSSLRLLRRRWDAFDTLALTVRYIFYSFALIFLFVTCGAVIEFIIAYLGLLKLDIHFGDWLFTTALFAVLALLYLVCKWRGFFDNIDEEQ
ncbi:MAG: hypothetical protein QXN21_04870 [Candidatus Bathyarchaeia archaeon]